MRLVLLVLVALAVLVALSGAREVDSSMTTKDAFPVLTDKFGAHQSINQSITLANWCSSVVGFEEDSSLNISLTYTPTNAPLRFLMCSEADVRNSADVV